MLLFCGWGVHRLTKVDYAVCGASKSLLYLSNTDADVKFSR